MEGIIPYGLDLFLLIIIPIIITILTFVFFFKKQNMNSTRFQIILISLIVSSILSIIYFAFDAFLLKATDMSSKIIEKIGARI